MKLIKTKTSLGMSASAWLLWIAGCMCGTAYGILLKRPELIFAYASELVLSVTIFVLVIKYKDNR